MHKAATHIAFLDSVRGLAALAVLNSHYVLSYDLPCATDFCSRLLTYSPLRIWWDGSAAVSMFFVLSGLVLSLKYFRHGSEPDLSRLHLGEYCASRVFRLWPPYFIALGLHIWLYRHYQAHAAEWPLTVPPQNDWIPSMWAYQVGWIDALRESFLLKMPDAIIYIPQAWTLAIELSLSLLVPLGILLLARSWLWLLFFTALALYLMDASPLLYHFALGMLIASRFSLIASQLRAHAVLRRFLLALGVVLYSEGSALEGIAHENLMWWLSGTGAGLLLLYTLGSDRAQALLSLAWPRYLGKISYSLYLLHLAVLIGATPWLLAALPAQALGFKPAWWMGLALTIALSVACAALSYRWVETPSMALGRRMGAWARGA
jgi:peptidoglycan/LPS O-acetylase OafA/YrhL